VRLFSAERETTLEPDGADDPSIHYALVWKHEPNQLSRLPNLKAIFSLGAGVDHILADPGLPDVPIIRVVDDSLTEPMVEYVVWRVLDHHRQGMLYRTQKQKKIWHEPSQRRAKDVSVGIMGLGSLGTAAAKALRTLSYQVNGWSRSPKAIEDVTSYSGQDGLAPFLSATDILVVLLPLTEATKGIIDYALLRQLRRRNALGGAVLINAGRGKLQSDDDILRALDDGTLKEATLDVFETEPLPKSSSMWEHPKLFITPHAAAGSDPEHLVPAMLAQMDALERGETLKNVVNRLVGY
jgi:glyoxylate/hydroxypyruvate reductase A